MTPAPFESVDVAARFLSTGRDVSSVRIAHRSNRGVLGRALAISMERYVDAIEVRAWRRLERTRLIARRMGLSPVVRRGFGERTIAALRPFLTERPGVLGAYWPFRAEFDPQPLIESSIAAGWVVALPVVVRRSVLPSGVRLFAVERQISHADPRLFRRNLYQLCVLIVIYCAKCPIELETLNNE
jgi:hypothetical protein